MATDAGSSPVRLLLLNPNSSRDMTHGMEEALKSANLPSSVQISTYTAPKEAPASINDDKDLEASTSAVLADLDRGGFGIHDLDAVLVACYSVHPLVTKLSERLAGRVLVMGIFESSILTSMALLPAYALHGAPLQTWGIVTTGKFWEAHLHDGVEAFLGPSLKFSGVYSTGLNAGDFHGHVPEELIRERIKAAAKKLLTGSVVRCIVMGCAGMAGLEAILRDAAIDQYGPEVGRSVYIIDGVKAGVGLLDQAVKNKRLFQQ